MKYAMDTKVNIKPVFASLVHSDVWEGPCRAGAPEKLTPEYDRRTGRSQFKIWSAELPELIDSRCANILEPVMIEYDEHYVVSEKEFAKLLPELPQTDMFLITYRVPGIERFGKAVSMVNTGPAGVDVTGYYRSIGLDSYLCVDYGEFNHLLMLLQVKKALASTNMLILPGHEQPPIGASCNLFDLDALRRKYGIGNYRLSYKDVFARMEEMGVTEEMEVFTDRLMASAEACQLPRAWLLQDVRYYMAVRSLLEETGCNAYTTACKELCVSRLPMNNHCVPCMTHSLLKDDRIPSACEEDLNALLTTAVLMYLTKKSVFMGNPTLIPAGTHPAYSSPWALVSNKADNDSLVSEQVFEEDIFAVTHSVPGVKMNGYDTDAMPHFIGHFTHEGWGAKLQVDLSSNSEKTATLARFNMTADKLLVARAEIVGCMFTESNCSPTVYFKVDGGARRFFHRLSKGSFGHHTCMVYGDYTQQLEDLGEIVGFEVLRSDL